MNPLKLPKIEPNPNGKAPHVNGGALASRQSAQRQPTTFASPQVEPSTQSLFYILNSFYLGGAPLLRYIVVPLFLLTLVWATGLLPGRWWGTGIFATLFIGLLLWNRQIRRRDYVRFDQQPLPAIIPNQLDPKDKIAIFATGHFSVEGKQNRFTWLPGFYRTFATGEHALLCLLQDRRVLKLLRWPEEDHGMWYVFISPKKIERIQWGELHFGAKPYPAIAITYSLHIPARRRFQSDQERSETVYLALDDKSEGHRLLNDLYHDVPPTVRHSSVVEQTHAG